MNTRDHLEEVINSNAFTNFCNNSKCPLRDKGCRHYCPIFALRIYLAANTP